MEELEAPLGAGLDSWVQRAGRGGFDSPRGVYVQFVRV